MEIKALPGESFERIEVGAQHIATAAGLFYVFQIRRYGRFLSGDIRAGRNPADDIVFRKEEHLYDENRRHDIVFQTAGHPEALPFFQYFSHNVAKLIIFAK